MTVLRSSNKARIVAKSRPTQVYLGRSGQPTFNPLTGFTYDGPDYPEYKKRASEDTCLAAYNAARTSPSATTVSMYLQGYGTEEIVGVVGNRGSNNNVTHTKIGSVGLPHLCMQRRYNSSGFNYADYYRYGPESGFARYLGKQCEEYAYIFQPGHDKGFSSRAFWSMRPKFEGAVSIINSIFELKDFRDVVNVKKLIKDFRSVSSSSLFSEYKREFNKLARDSNIRAKLHERGLGNYSDIGPDALKKLARDGSGSAAAGVLAMNLAIKPTIADALAIAGQFVTSAMQAQNTFAEYGSLGSASHFSENRILDNTTRLTGNYYFLALGNHVKIQQTATMRSFYEYKLREKNQALVRYWGLAGTTEALWNMLPLSFVLDYVFTVGKSLKYMVRDDNVVNLTTDYCESSKIIASDGTSIIQDSSVPALVIDGIYLRPTTKRTPHLVTGTQAVRYTRRAMEPYKGPALPKWKMPSSTQAVNTLALARLFA